MEILLIFFGIFELFSKFSNSGPECESGFISLNLTMVAKVGCKYDSLKTEYPGYGNGPGKNGTYKCLVFRYFWQVRNIPKNATLVTLSWMKNSGRNTFWAKPENVIKNRKFHQKSNFWSKIESFIKNRIFGQKSKVSSKIEFMVKY